MVKNDDSLYDFKLENITGETQPLSDFQGQVVLIVNTASECGFTTQYEGLQSLHEKYYDRGFQVLGFPANNFGGQEPGSDEQIQSFCKSRYGVTFPLFSKISVSGEDCHPLYSWLTAQETPDGKGAIKWNFEKFLIDRKGKVVRRFRSITGPGRKKIRNSIEELL